MAPPADRDPEALLARARGGEPSAVGDLLEHHRNYLALVVRLEVGSRLRSKLDVEDLVQEALLAAHRGFGRFRGATSTEFLAWLRQVGSAVASNQVRRFLGTRRRDVRLERSLGSDPGAASDAVERAFVAPGSSPSQQASRREQALLLADALATLPEDYREVIILRQLEDLPFPDVAARMGRTVDSVKNLWVRALARLRRAMEAGS